MPLKTLPALVLAAIGASVALPAAAQDYRFSYYNHELQTAAGAERVYNRIVRTAENECDPIGRRPLYAERIANACEADMIEDIVFEIDHPRLNRVYAAAQDEAEFASR